MDRARKPSDSLREREEEATEKETLKDLEESFGDSESAESEEQKVPSPDGAFDEGDELEEADPL
jgi:hypothetical protein